jgi:hypothetical protein
MLPKPPIDATVLVVPLRSSVPTAPSVVPSVIALVEARALATP